MIKIDTGFGVVVHIDKDTEIVEVENKLSNDKVTFHGLVKCVKGGKDNGTDIN